MLMIGDPPSSGSTVPKETPIWESLVKEGMFSGAAGFCGYAERRNKAMPLVTLPAAFVALTCKRYYLPVSVSKKVSIWCRLT